MSYDIPDPSAAHDMDEDEAMDEAEKRGANLRVHTTRNRMGSTTQESMHNMDFASSFSNSFY